MNSRVVALAASVLVACASPASAQSTPTPAPRSLPAVPPGVVNAVEGVLGKLAGDAVAPYGVDPNHIRGTVTFFQRFTMQVRMPLNQYRNVVLHQGTVIDPRGTTLRAGQVIDIHGHPNPDGSFAADQITLIR